MQTRDVVEGLHNCLEFSQPSSCLDETIKTRKKCSIAACVCYSTRFYFYTSYNREQATSALACFHADPGSILVEFGFGVLVFAEGGGPRNPDKISGSKD